ncbi:MAG: hypothetical protein KAU28_07420, partial [Phycisphaerae bacterium]|nr:hypothetical protein [Phycisphaerae bacterium]
MPDSTYESDLEFLRKHTDIIELASPGEAREARVAVAPAYQGRVMTSTLSGVAAGEPGFGWINTAFIKAGEQDPHFNNYGGEDRFWLGPEGGQFALWFAEGEPFDMAHWKTPKGFGTGTFEVTSHDEKSVAMATRFEVENYSGTRFDCAVNRTIAALDSSEVAGLLGAAVPGGLAMVAFESVNTLTNAGEAAWTKEAGLLSIWTLGQYKPLPRGKVIVPFNAGD